MDVSTSTSAMVNGASQPADGSGNTDVHQNDVLDFDAETGSAWSVPADSNMITWEVNAGNHLIASTTSAFNFLEVNGTQSRTHDYGTPEEAGVIRCLSIPATPSVTDECVAGNATWNIAADTAQVTWSLNNRKRHNAGNRDALALHVRQDAGSLRHEANQRVNNRVSNNETCRKLSQARLRIPINGTTRSKDKCTKVNCGAEIHHPHNQRITRFIPEIIVIED